MFTIDANDTQSIRALELERGAASWLRIRSRETGRVIGYGIPSQSQVGLFHAVSPACCDCKAWAYRRSCVHVRAAVLHVELARARAASQSLPAHLVVDRQRVEAAAVKYGAVFGGL